MRALEVTVAFVALMGPAVALAQIGMHTGRNPGGMTDCGACSVERVKSFFVLTQTQYEPLGPPFPGGSCFWQAYKVKSERCPTHPNSCPPLRTIADLKIIGSKQTPAEPACRESAFPPTRNPWPDIVSRNLGYLTRGQLVRMEIPQWFVGDFYLRLEDVPWLYLKNDPDLGPIIAGAVPLDQPLGGGQGRARAVNSSGEASDNFTFEVPQ